MSLSHCKDPAAIPLCHRRYFRFSFWLGIALLLSELWKQWLLTARIWGSYQVWYFPFQLCSLPMYLCPLMAIVPEQWQNRIRTFLMTFTLLGGAAAFLDTSGMYYPTPALTIHSWLWHILLILIGLWSGVDYCLDLQEHRSVIREFSGCLPIFGAAILIATLLNIVLWPYGEISMFYISPYEAGTQPIVPLVAGKIGIPAAHILYLMAMAASAFLLHCLWHRLRRLR